MLLCLELLEECAVEDWMILPKTHFDYINN